MSNDTATTEIYTLSLHDALPIYLAGRSAVRREQSRGDLHHTADCRRLCEASHRVLLDLYDQRHHRTNGSGQGRAASSTSAPTSDLPAGPPTTACRDTRRMSSQPSGEAW